jgi:hypothetical protein
MVPDIARVKSIFLAAVERYSAEQWPAYLDEACGEDAALWERVEELLRAHVGQKSLDVPAPSQPGETIDQPSAERPGTNIGPYKIRWLRGVKLCFWWLRGVMVASRCQALFFVLGWAMVASRCQALFFVLGWTITLSTV